MSGGVSRWYLLVGGVTLTAYFVPSPAAGNSWLYQAAALSTVVALVVGIRRYRPQPRLPWLLFVLSYVAFAAGDVTYYLFPVESPSLSDLLYLAYYPLQAAGLLLLIRSRTPGRGWAELLDSLMVAVGAGLLAWLYLIEPLSRSTTGTDASRLVALSYPVMDVILLGVAARLLVGASRRTPAFVLILGSIVAMVLTDLLYARAQASGSYADGSWLDAGWLISYFLWGAAVLHPSMRLLSAPTPQRDDALTAQRILLLAAAVLIGPATLAANEIWTSDGFDRPVALSASVAIFLLALVRMLGLASSLRDAISRHQRAERRERVLRHVAMELTTGADRERIRLAALQGAHDLVEDRAGVEVVVDLCPGQAGTVAKPPVPPGALVVTLATQAATYGRLLVSGATDLSTEVVDGLRALGAQVALALEGAALTEDLRQQHSEAMVGALVQNSSEMIMVIDVDLRIRYVTPSVAQNLGHAPEDLIGKPATWLSHPDDAEAISAFYTRLIEEPHGSVTAEWRMQRADGVLTDVEAVSTNLLDNPAVRGIVVTAHDITERKALAEGLERQVVELEELDRIKSEFVATVSHELRTPLTSIMGEVELLQDGDRGLMSPCQADGVGVIGRSSQRLLMLIEDLLTLNQIENSALNLNRVPTSVDDLVESVIAEIGPIADEKGVELTHGYVPTDERVLVDRDQLYRAVLNLLTNAVKFTPAGGSVRVRAQREADELVLTVADTGFGVPPEEQDLLFTRFFRSSVATRMAIQGTGLGLVIVKTIVEEHGGTIALESAPDRGTTVTVRIPWVAGEDRERTSRDQVA